MPKLTVRVPKYRKFAPRNLAFVEIQGKRHYLPGAYGSAESKEAYRRLLVEWESAGRPSTPPPPQSDLTIIELMAKYVKHAKAFYVDRDGVRTSENYCIIAALKLVKEIYGRTLAVEFGPKALAAVRDAMVKAGMSRGTVNRQIHRVRRLFRWAASEELLPVTVYQALTTLAPLKRGRTTAYENEPVEPVADCAVEATLPHLTTIVADMIRLQRATGARPAEICMIRPGDIDRSGEVWAYKPSRHKTEHHGKGRVIMLGPKAQGVLLPYLLRPADSFCFSPAESAQQARDARTAARTTPLSCGNRPGSNRKAKPKRQPGERYTTVSYRRAIQRACEVAGIDSWSPNQLRHSAATEIRAKYGIEAARTVLGHSTAFTTEVYAEKDMVQAAAIARQIG